MTAARTFWEKATILHEEANRPGDNYQDRGTISRVSRHYYDLAMLAASDIRSKALTDLDLLERVATHKKQFFPRGWAKFDEATPGTLKLVPPEFRMKGLRDDYAAMQLMMFEEPPSFDWILGILRALEQEINALPVPDGLP